MESASNKELTITRIINAPRQLVFKAWIESEKLARWWGPTGFTSIVHIWNPEPGGEILIDMVAPDETVYPMDGKFHEIIPNEKIVFTSAALDDKQERLFEILNTITFVEDGDKTKLLLHFIFSNIKPEGLPYIGGAEVGWNQSLDRLDTFVKHAPLVIERTYNAPISKVWSALTNNAEMKQWYFDLPEFKAEVGFEFTFTGGPAERKYVHLCKITEVAPGKKLSYSWRYEGYEGNSTVSFELFAEGDKTTLKLTHQGLETFPASNADFVKSNFVEGWTHIAGTSLKNYLEKSQNA